MTVDKNPDELLAQAYALASKEDTKALYKDWAKTYDKTMLDGLGYLTPHITSRLLDKYLDETQARILDVGCGTGLAGAELSKLGYTGLEALDYSPQMLEVAKSREIYQAYYIADLNEPLDIASNCFDALICTGTFTHAHVDAQCLGELFRILKPGGLFACTIHKDVWKEGGFENKIKTLGEQKIIQTRIHQADKYFSSDTEKQGTYYVFQRL